jgi:hypothetical protein
LLSFRRGSFLRLSRPSISQNIVALLGLDPDCSARTFDLFPEWGTGLEVVHEKLGSCESILPVRRGGDDENYLVAGQKPTDTMDHAHAKERPALLGRLHVSRDLRLGHSGVVLERHGKQRRARFLSSANACESDNGPDIGAPARKLERLSRGIEWFALQMDSGGHRYSPH